MIEHARLEMSRIIYNIAFSGKYTYLAGSSGLGRAQLSDTLQRHEFSGLGTLIGPKKIYGGKFGAAFNHYFEDNCVLVINEDVDAVDMEEYLSYIVSSNNQFIFCDT